MFTSCERDNDIDTIIDVTPTEEVDVNPLVSRSQGGNGEGMAFNCFVINYTFSFVDVEGTEYPVSSDADLIALFESDVEISITDFVYPLTVSTDTGETQVNNVEDLEALFASCVPSGGWEEGDFPAFSVNYDNSCYALDYPVSVTNVDGETVEDIDQLFDALIGCNGFGVSDTLVGADWDWEGGFEYLGCYMLEFPFDITLVDGSVVTVNNHEELCDYMLTGVIVDYVYPLTLTGDDGAAHVVNSAAELEALLTECEDIWTIDFDGDVLLLYIGTGGFDDAQACYDITFPIEVTDNTTVSTVSDIEALDAIAWGGEPQSLVYPIEVVLQSDGSVFTVEGIESLFELLTICE